jgi:uncharacterized membrane protein YfcA
MSHLLVFTDPWVYAAMAGLVLFAAFMQGLGGVGFAMFAAPVAAIFFPDMVPGALLTLGGFVALLTTLRERHAVLWPAVGSALAGRAVGTIIAIFALAQLPQSGVNLLFAVLILAAVALSAAGLRIAATRNNIAIAGVLSGVMGTLTSVGAPPLAIALQHTPPPNLRATLGFTLFCGSSFSLLMLSFAGRYNLQQFWLSITLLPFMLAGFALSSQVHKKVGPTLVRRLLLGFCATSAVGLIIKTI